MYTKYKADTPLKVLSAIFFYIFLIFCLNIWTMWYIIYEREDLNKGEFE